MGGFRYYDKESDNHAYIEGERSFFLSSLCFEVDGVLVLSDGYHSGVGYYDLATHLGEMVLREDPCQGQTNLH